MTTIDRVRFCGQHRITTGANPSVRLNGGVGHFAGVQLCGSIHNCPVCSPRIRQQRAVEIDAAAATWIAAGGSVMLLTLTMPHDYGDKLSDVLGTVRDSFGAMVSGRAWQADKAGFGIQHYIVAHDATVGPSGWHPHLHTLLFGDAPLDDAAVLALGDRLHGRWSNAVTKRGYRAPSRLHGVQLEHARNRSDVAAYISQVVAGDALDDKKTVPVALEMARGDLKTSRHAGHRTHWQLLADLTTRRASAGEWTLADDRADSRDVRLWREWERATKGLRAMRWSKGLRRAVGLDDEKTDEEIVAEEIGGAEIFRFVDVDSWKAVSSTPGARTAVLRAAESGGAREVSWVVDETLRAWRARRLLRLRPPAERPRGPRAPRITERERGRRTLALVLAARETVNPPAVAGTFQ